VTSHICAACGTCYPASPAPPLSCPICDDDRQYAPRSGQRWVSHEELGRSFTNRIEDDDGVLGIGMTPDFAINQRCALIETVHGNVMWESTSLVTDEAIAAIRRRGPVVAIAISHPHFYTAMHLWADALDCPITLPAADCHWIQHPSPRIRVWDGDRLELVPGLTMVRCGGHFAGSSVLHWKDGRCPDGALFVGDTVQVSQDRKRVSAMHSYPNASPLRTSAIERVVASLADLRYQRIYGYTWGRNITERGDQAVTHSFGDNLHRVSS
jgi:glyoxylase-like metal-dependent hydrolase (beta-lactamase superfamily II)